MNKVPFRFFLISLLFSFLFFFSQARAATFVGAHSCKDCHEKAYKTWRRSGHANTMDHLTSSKENELRCLFCHSTDAQTKLSEYQHENVQCEACHGPGSTHVQMARQNRSTKANPGGLQVFKKSVCQSCHDSSRSPSLRPFDYSRAKMMIRHW